MQPGGGRGGAGEGGGRDQRDVMRVELMVMAKRGTGVQQMGLAVVVFGGPRGYRLLLLLVLVVVVFVVEAVVVIRGVVLRMLAL